MPPRVLAPPARDPARLLPIDGLRAVAVLWTMAFHAFFIGGFRPHATIAETRAFLLAPLNRLILRADLGVDVFFVISGFLIGGLLMDEWSRTGTLDVRRFQVRRALRIVPAYFATLGIALVLSGGLDLARLPTNLLFINNYVSIQSELLPHAWSLAVEMQFYLALPFLMLLCWRRERLRLPLLVGLLVAAFVVRAIVVARLGMSLPVSIHPRLDAAGYLRYVDRVYQPTHMRFGDFACGALAAFAVRRGLGAALARRLGIARLGLAAAAALIAAVIAVPPFSATPFWSGVAGTVYLVVFPYLFSLAAAYILLVLVTAPAAAPRLARALSTRPLYGISQISYSMYLLHPLIMFAGYFTVLDLPSLPRLPVYVLFVVVSMLLAALMWVAVERPFQRLRPPRAAAAA